MSDNNIKDVVEVLKQRKEMYESIAKDYALQALTDVPDNKSKHEQTALMFNRELHIYTEILKLIENRCWNEITIGYTI